VEGKEADQRSDIYSLGVILYEMVTGNVPFDGETPLSIAVKHTTQNPQDPKEMNAQIPEELSRVILTCMEKDREKRYQSTKQLLEELDRVEKNIPYTQKFLPTKEHKDTTQITVSLSLKNIFIPAVAFVLIAILGIIGWQWMSQKETILAHMDKPSLTVLRFENRSGDRSLDHWRSGIWQLLITDLGQSKFLRVPSGERVRDILKRLKLWKTNGFNTADLKKVTTLAKTDHILSGSFSTQGEELILIAMLQNPHTGHVLSSRRVRCQTEEEIPVKIDELAKRIKLDLGISPDQLPGDIDEDLATVLTGFM
jgi:serine/threonine protein kinase